MRVLVVTQQYPPEVNGFAIQCADAARLLSRRGHQVRVLTSCVSRDRGTADADLLRLLTVSPTEDHKSLSPRYLLRQMARRRVFGRNALIAKREALNFAPDVIYVWQFNALGLGLVQHLQSSGAPTVLNVGDSILCDLVLLLESDPNLPWRIARRYLYGVDARDLRRPHLIVPSQELQKYYLRGGFDPGRMSVVHNGIDSRYLRREPPDPGLGTKLLYAGRVHPSKGVETAVRALAILNSRSKGRYTLDVIGSGSQEYVGRVGQLAATLNVGSSLRFHGPIDRDSLLEHYQRYNVLLFPSQCVEAFGLTVVEAMAQGLPVVASDRGGPKDIIVNMQNGILVDPDRPAAFADAVALLAADPTLRRTIARNAWRKVAGTFTLEKHVEATERVLRRVLADQRPGPS